VANRNKVVYETAFKEWGAECLAGFERVILESSALMAEAAKTAEVRRHSGALADSIHVLPVVTGATIIEGGIGAGDYKANWYEFGTLGRRSRHKSKRGKADKAGGRSTGVKGLHYLRKGLYAGRSDVFGKLARVMESARGLG
jgi:hypothetical protein